VNTFGDTIRALAFGATILAIQPQLLAADSAAPVLKYDEPKLLHATVYSADRKRVLFKFVRRSVRDGNRLTVSREFTYPDGQPALKEQVVYDGDDLSEYDMENLQLGSRGSAKIIKSRNRPTISFEFQKDAHSTKKPKTATEPFTGITVIGDTLGLFLTDHWDQLVRGDEVKCRYIVIDRRETVGFTFVKDSEKQRDGRNLIIVKMFPTSRLISALVDPLYFTIEKDGKRRVLEYSGRTPLKMKEAGKWKDLDGITVFEW
jgi:hypothetical protein